MKRQTVLDLLDLMRRAAITPPAQREDALKSLTPSTSAYLQGQSDCLLDRLITWIGARSRGDISRRNGGPTDWRLNKSGTALVDELDDLLARLPGADSTVDALLDDFILRRAERIDPRACKLLADAMVGTQRLPLVEHIIPCLSPV